MLANAMRQNGYMSATRSTGTPRDVEYQLFSRVTGRLNRADSESAGFSELAEALHENLALWTTIGLDVMESGNGLPDSLRAQLFYLFEFTRGHTQKVLRREADASALVDVNTAVMRGLRPGAVAKGADTCPA